FIRMFCYQVGRPLEDDIRRKIIEFWEAFYQHYKSCIPKGISKEDTILLSDSLNIISVLNDISRENYHMLDIAIPYAEANFNAYE
ncbi:hypothetical protein OFC21_32730, partial [Escherichia coli]|nr:hypothetical protein [Escherichia coli]